MTLMMKMFLRCPDLGLHVDEENLRRAADSKASESGKSADVREAADGVIELNRSKFRKLQYLLTTPVV